MASLVPSMLGLAGHAIALYGKRIDVPDTLLCPVPTRYLGSAVWLTIQTNVVCCFYYAAATASCVVRSEALANLVVHFFPLAFGLAFVLTILYYGLDHFNPESVRKRKMWSEKGYPSETCAHLEHASATPLALLYAFSLRLPSGGAEPSVGPLLAFLAWYVAMSFANRMATGEWLYPIVDDAHKVVGWLGVVLFFATISGLCLASGFLGLWIIVDPS